MGSGRRREGEGDLGLAQREAQGERGQVEEKGPKRSEEARRWRLRGLHGGESGEDRQVAPEGPQDNGREQGGWGGVESVVGGEKETLPRQVRKARGGVQGCHGGVQTHSWRGSRGVRG